MRRYAKCVAAIATAVAIVWFYFWITAPNVVGIDGPERPRIPAGLAIAVAVSLLGWWGVLVSRAARRDGHSLRSRSIVGAFALVATPLLLSVFLIVFSNEVFGVMLFLTAGIPAFLGASLVSFGDNSGSASGSKMSEYLNEPEKARRAKVRKRVLWAIAGLLVAIGALLAFIGFPFSNFESEMSSETSVVSRSDDFSNIRGEFRETSQRSPLGAVGDCITIMGPSRNDVTVHKANCADKSAAYRIFQLAEQADDCAVDSDQRYAPRQKDEGNLILCLDYNWAHGLCIFPGSSHGLWHAVRDDCKSGGQRPIEVQYDTANAQRCATGGYPHQVRRFTICSIQLP